jgi:hypothetical protein
MEGLRVGLALLVGHRSAGHIGFDADDRFDPLVLRGLIEGDGAVEGSVVGQGQRIHALLRRRVDELRDPTEPIEQAEFGVDMEMREVVRGSGHGRQW